MQERNNRKLAALTACGRLTRSEDCSKVVSVVFGSTMRAAQSVQCRFEGEMAALAARVQSFGDRPERYALFDALRDLEDRASTGGAAGSTLRKIAEIRFFAGILREAVRPFPRMSLRTMLRACGAGDMRVSASAVREG